MRSANNDARFEAEDEEGLDEEEEESEEDEDVSEEGVEEEGKKGVHNHSTPVPRLMPAHLTSGGIMADQTQRMRVP